MEKESINIIKKIREDKDLSQETLAEILDISRELVNKMENNKSDISPRTKERIREKFGASYLNSNVKLNSQIIQIGHDSFMEVKYLPITAYAGYSNGFSDEEYIENLDTLLVPKEFEKGNYLVIEINGDSMDDGTDRAIKDRDRILCKELSKDLWNNKLNMAKYLFVIVTPDGPVCKQITKHNTITGEITCHSWNDFYDDFTLYLNDVYQLFYVKKIVERKIRM